MSTPIIGTDTTYEEHRRDRLQECIEDYLQDGFGDNTDPRYVYEEMLAVIQQLADYHEKHRARYAELKNYMLGYNNHLPDRF